MNDHSDHDEEESIECPEELEELFLGLPELHRDDSAEGTLLEEMHEEEARPASDVRSLVQESRSSDLEAPLPASKATEGFGSGKGRAWPPKRPQR